MQVRHHDAGPSDEQLAMTVARREDSDIACGDARTACEELYARHGRKLLAFLSSRVKRNDLEDVHQAVWERVWHHLPRSFTGGNFRAWLHQIARNYIIDSGRRKRMDLWDGETELEDTRRAAPEETIVAQERADALRRCLGQLAEDAAALVRARLAGESYDEICGRLSIRAAQAHKLFHTAKEQLRNCVERSSA